MHAGTMQKLQRYTWPGNVRELRNVIERNLILNTGPIFRAEIPELEEKPHRAIRHLDEVRNTCKTCCKPPSGASEEKAARRKS